MIGRIIQFVVIAGTVFLIANNVPGIHVEGGYKTVLFVALVWSLVSMVLKPVLSILTLPLTFITLGLFSFILNAFLFAAMEWVVPGFVVDGFIPALIGSVVLSFVTWVTSKVT